MIKNKSIQAGTIIVAEEQTAGKGQRGKVWESQAGQGFYGSIFLEPDFLQANQGFQLSIFASVAIASCLKETYGFSSIRLKWPNDIYFLNFKIGGILIENHLNHLDIAESIIGIGINLNQDKFSTELVNPISLRLIDGKNKNSKDFIENLMPFLNSAYFKLKMGQFDELFQSYNQLLWKKGEKIQFLHENKQSEGILLGIDHNGWIKVQTESEILVASYPKLSILIP